MSVSVTQRALWLAVLIVAACARQERDPRPMMGGWLAEVRAVGEHGHSGFAIVSMDADGVTRANVTLTGGSAHGKHPWHVHEGSCDSVGPPVGDPAAYPPLEPDESGGASATYRLPIMPAHEKSYAVSIHQSMEDDTIVGCGEMVPNR